MITDIPPGTKTEQPVEMTWLLKSGSQISILATPDVARQAADGFYAWIKTSADYVGRSGVSIGAIPGTDRTVILYSEVAALTIR